MTWRPALAQVPLEPGREQARGWAIDELAGREYAAQRPGLVARAFQRVLEWLQELDLPDTRGGSILLTVALVLLVVLAAVAVHRSGGLRRQGGGARAGAVLGGRVRTAAEHRAQADRHAEAGDYRAAVVERFRAVARELQERALVSGQPGRTAHELAGEAAALLTELGPDLHAGAALFDAVRYGAAAASADDDAGLRRLDEQVRRARVPAVR